MRAGAVPRHPYVTGTLIPSLASQGVDPSTFPIFLFDNVVMSIGSPSIFKKCCILGYHGAFGFPAQTYSPLDFDTSGIFGTGTDDTAVMSHEVGEWMDEPLGTILLQPGDTSDRWQAARIILKSGIRRVALIFPR
jgi:hypothetical protein